MSGIAQEAQEVGGVEQGGQEVSEQEVSEQEGQEVSETVRVRAEGVELSVRVSGPEQGVPVIVLHGFTGSSGAMSPLTDRLDGAFRTVDELGRPLRMIVPDLVGHGRSEAPDDPSAYRVEAMARQVAALADTLGLQSFHAVGYSMGGRVALMLGCAAARRLRSLTLIGATAGIANPDERHRRARADSARAERITDDFHSFMDEWTTAPPFARKTAPDPQQLAADKAQRLASNPQGLALSLRHGGTGAMTPLHSQLGDCDMPALLVVGFHDHKFCSIAEELAAGLPDAAIMRIAGAGHATHLERPDTTVTALSLFIAAVEEEAAMSTEKAQDST